MTTQVDSKTITYHQLAKTIDHSLLRPELAEADVIAGCELAARYDVASVCVKPYHVKLAKQVLAGTDVSIGTVVGFPHGSNNTETKVFEAQRAIAEGATELDMVLNIGELRSGHNEYVKNDIGAVVAAAQAKAIVKVILENAYLTDEEIMIACQLCEQAGADFVKTSTGFAPGGATIPDLILMRSNVGPQMQVKAAGGIRTLEALLEVIDVGATRVGATATAVILDDFKQRKNLK